jgi:hypothetical protein
MVVVQICLTIIAMCKVFSLVLNLIRWDREEKERNEEEEETEPPAGIYS